MNTDPMEFPKLVTGGQMSAIDRLSIEMGVPGTELMERAGAGVVQTVQERWSGLEGLRVAVVCGKGNNAGDGFVVGRRLVEAGVPASVYLAAPRGEIGGDAAHHLKRLEAEAGPVVRPPPEDLTGALGEADLVIDALLGTGLRGPPRAGETRIIESVNDCGRPVVAVDLPSGVQADTGAVAGACVRAAVTVTFGLVKVGHMFHPGRAHCGALELVDIGFPEGAISRCPATSHLLTREGIAGLLPRRSPVAHKGSCGAVAVVAGSEGMTGAACLTADAALRAGAGRVRLGAPASLHDILETKLTEVMTRPLPEVRRARCLSLRALGEVLRLLDKAQALAIGPGLGRHGETGELVRRLLSRPDLPPTVVDADALHALAEAGPGPAPDRVLTPHAGEFQRLSGCDPDRIAEDPLGLAAEFAAGRSVVLVLKGAPTVVAAPDGRTFVNPTGNAGMATAGSGDVLTGLVAGLLAQGVPALAAAACAVYIHGLAGDLARDGLGPWSMRAGDICEQVPRALLEVSGQGAIS